MTGGSGLAARIGSRVRFVCGICAAWLVGLPRRAAAQLYAMTDAEARWWYWRVTERCGGLVHQYRDSRFEVLGYDPAIRREEIRAELPRPDAPPPDCPCAGSR